MSNWLVIVISLFASALFSGVEISFVSSNRLKLELDLKKKRFSAKLINHFVRHQSQFMGCILIGNNIANVIYGIAMAKMLGDPIRHILPEAINNEFVILLCQTFISTLLVLLVAEFIPKTLFRINPNKLMNVMALPMMVLYIILYPLIFIYIHIHT